MATERLDILVSLQDQASKSLNTIEGKMNKMAATAQKVGFAFAAVGGAITAGFGVAVKEAADAEGALAKFETVFADNTDAMLEFVDELRGEMPTARQEIIRMAADLQDLLVPLGLSRDQATEMSQGILDLSNKIAAFNDVDPTEVIDAFRSGLTGSSEPLKRFGINASVTALEARAMEEGLLSAGQQLKDLDEATRSQVVAQALLAQGLAQSSDAINGFEANNDSFLRRWQDLQATMQEFQAKIGAPVLEVVDNMLKKISPLIDKIGEWIDQNPELAGNIAIVVAAIGALMLALSPILIAMPAIIGGFQALASAVLFLISPVGLVVVAIGALIAIGYLLVKNWDIIKAKAKEVVQPITDFIDVVKALGKWLKAGFEDGDFNNDWLTHMPDWLANAAQAFGGFLLDIADFWDQLKTLVSDSFTSIVTFITETWDSLINGVTEKFQAFVERMRAIGQMVMNVLMFVFGFGIGLIITIFEKMGIDIVAVIIDSFEKVKQAISSAIDFITNTFTSFQEKSKSTWEGIQDTFEKVWDAIIQILQFALEGLILILEPWWEGLKMMFTAQLEALRFLWEFGLLPLWEFLKGIFTSIVGTVTEKFGALKTRFDSGLETLRSGWNNFWSGAANTVSSVWETIKATVKAGLNWIIEKINSFIRSANAVAAKGNVIPGVSVPQIPEIPFLAQGGIVTQPTLAMIGEGGESEAIVPLSKAQQMGFGGGGINLNLYMSDSVVATEETVIELIGDPIIEVLKKHASIV